MRWGTVVSNTYIDPISILKGDAQKHKIIVGTESRNYRYLFEMRRYNAPEKNIYA